MRYLKVLVAAAGLLPGGGLLAHPGHGHSGDGLWHYLLEPAHLIGAVAVLVGLLALVFVLLRLRREADQR